MIFDYCFKILRMVCSIELIILHDELDQPLVPPDTVHNWFEVALELIAREVDLLELVVVTDECLANDAGRLIAHALIPERESVFSLCQSHLSDESLLLLIGLAR